MSSVPQSSISKPGEQPSVPNLDFSAGARAVVVNRTHRVVREEALTMQAQRSKSRSLWLPLTIFTVLTLAICYAIWFMLDGYDITPNGIPDADDQLVVLLLWSLPVTALLLAMVWLRRVRSRRDSHEETQR
jgi:flagellar basal body-associated protein FliL